MPTISTVWGEGLAPLNQTREETREDIRRIIGLPLTLDVLGDLTTNMNATGELSAPATLGIEGSVAEYKTLEAVKIAAQSTAAWEGSAPLKKADVVEYDTSLLANGSSTTAQMQGINERLGQLEHEIKTALGMHTHGGQARLNRS